MDRQSSSKPFSVIVITTYFTKYTYTRNINLSKCFLAPLILICVVAVSIVGSPTITMIYVLSVKASMKAENKLHRARKTGRLASLEVFTGDNLEHSRATALLKDRSQREAQFMARRFAPHHRSRLTCSSPPSPGTAPAFCRRTA